MEKGITAVVFGGSGFLGSHVCDKLADAGYRVIVYDRSPSIWIRSDQTMVVGDIMDETLATKVLKDANIVFNFAGVADIGEANDRPVDTVRYNILGNTVLLEACRKAEIERYVFASSVYVYSNSGGFYRCSKQACELYIEEYQKTFGLNYVILRYGSLYGPRANEKNAIYRFVLEAFREKKISYFGSPEALREYIHVEDAAQCSVEALKPEYKNERLVLTGHQSIKVGNVLKMIDEMLAFDIQFEFEQNPDNSHYEVTPYSFNTRIGRKLTPKLHVDLGQGILYVIEEVYKKLHPEFHVHHGALLRD